MTLERLRADHADALLAFEHANRAYFARTVPDRGDEFFTPAGRRPHGVVAGRTGRRYLPLPRRAGRRRVPGGRVNLLDVADGSAEPGYRVGERAAGRGLATAAVAELCRTAATSYRLTTLVARTTLDNLASRAVPEKNRFLTVGHTTINGRPALRYRRGHLGA